MTPQELFVQVHEGLPRQGPGSDECTRRALQMLAPFPPRMRVLDLGCGPGAQTLVLARETGASVLAVDLHQPFLDDLARRAAEAGLAEQIRPVHTSMDRLEVKSEVYDLIWSEGAAYIMGVKRALQTWHRWLRPGGGVGLSEVSWLVEDPPDEVRRFWDRHYPAMQDVAANLHMMAECGYVPLGHFVLPESAWWDDYYRPMEERLAQLREICHNREDLLMTLDEEAQEIDLFRRHPATYGYVFYVLRRP